MSDRDAKFQSDLFALVPHLRAFARTFTGDAVDADDLVQDTLMKSWQSRDSFTPGTNMKGWTFTILRNLFYSEKRRSWRRQELDPETAERTLVASDDPTAAHELDDLRRAMKLLPDEQREALILIGAAGLSYDEAAEILGCAIGTIKSRVSRARASLTRILEEGDLPADLVPSYQAFDLILDEANRIRAA